MYKLFLIALISLTFLLYPIIQQPVQAIDFTNGLECKGTLAYSGIITDISFSPAQIIIQGPVTINVSYDPSKIDSGRDVNVMIFPKGWGEQAKLTATKIPDDKSSPLKVEFAKISDYSFIRDHWLSVEIPGVDGHCRTPEITITTIMQPLGVYSARCTLELSNTQFKRGDPISSKFVTQSFTPNPNCQGAGCPNFPHYKLFLFNDSDGSIKRAIQNNQVIQNINFQGLGGSIEWKPNSQRSKFDLAFPNGDNTHDISVNINNLNLDLGNYVLLGVASDYNVTGSFCGGLGFSVALDAPAPPPGPIISSPAPSQTPTQALKCGEKDASGKEIICAKSGGDTCGDANNPGFKTAIGCIHTKPDMLVKDILTFAVAISGGLAFLMMLLGAYQMLASQGNPETLTAGKDRLTNAIIGLLFVIFSVLLMQIIGFDILKIPGFSRV